MSQLAVIFDMDGVLVDSYHAHFESWSRLYGELGIAYTEAAFAADFGRTSRDILRRTLGASYRTSECANWTAARKRSTARLSARVFPPWTERRS